MIWLTDWTGTSAERAGSHCGQPASNESTENSIADKCCVTAGSTA